MGPKLLSYFWRLSLSAANRRLACMGFMMTRERIVALGVPGSIWAKSRMISLGLWEMIAKLL